jgi:hypothetical protein
MQVTTLSNGQIEVKNGNLTLIHSEISGIKFNDCSVNHGDVCELVSSNDIRFKDMFIALVNYKNGY